MYVSPTELRAVAATLDCVRTQLPGDRTPGMVPVEDEFHPEWAATAAMRALSAALDDGLAAVSRLCAEAAEAIRVAATAYEAADARRQAQLMQTRRSAWEAGVDAVPARTFTPP